MYSSLLSVKKEYKRPDNEKKKETRCNLNFTTLFLFIPLQLAG